ncbi:MAG TPA: tRNA (N(6)-L-threonylcarbamoyladenosine(37)-C(2))-methylthiotransferase MtaB [Bacteroidales bacterium]|nr:tRNA (N(6)-L-threonylcarbamoyladenosine(37)-C(2))-methylthiotransferase MtaB [Bacteroidales bacterium]
MSKRVAFRTLGCRLNLYETDALADTFHKAGYEIADFNEVADIYIINTCTVTNQSDRKSRQVINQALKRTEGGFVVVTGCMVNNHKESLLKAGKAHLFIDNEHKSALFSIVDAHTRGEVINPDSLPEDLFGYGAARHTFHTRSIIKVQDGCDNFCTFCIIPSVRGRAISRPFQDILDNVRQVVDYGFKEVVLTGVNIGRYQDAGHGFDDLVEKILALPGDFRVRISSIEPDGFGDKLISLFAHPKLAPHMHLCLQSGSDRILLQMRRMYTIQRFREIVSKVKAVVPDFNFTTDIITGFPGESPADFQETCTMARDIGFSHIHTFKYSIRDGTRAARMTDQVSEETKSARSAVIREISHKNKLRYYGDMLGKTQHVIIETIENGMAHGFGEHYIPVVFPVLDKQHNDWAQVILEDVEDLTSEVRVLARQILA